MSVVQQIKNVLDDKYVLVKLEGILTISDKDNIIFRRIPLSYINNETRTVLTTNKLMLYSEKDPVADCNYVIVLPDSTKPVVTIFNHKKISVY